MWARGPGWARVTAVTGPPAASRPVYGVLFAAVLAQAIAVVANPAFRPTPVLLANAQYTVAVDSASGGLVIRDLTVPPATFAGTIRIEGAEPFAREAEPRAYADSVRFEPDGRVRLLFADRPGRRPIEVEVQGGRAATGGRLVFRAPVWPMNRVMVVTFRPADIAEAVFREAGSGARDRLVLDDRRGFAFLTDSSVGGQSVAIGFGRGARGRMQSDVAEVRVRRRIGQDWAEERHIVGALTVFLEPERDSAFTARAELIFGLGPDAEAAARAAALAASDPQASAAPAAPLRVGTPEAVVGTLVSHTLASAWPTLSAGWIPAALDAPYQRIVATAAAVPLAVQGGHVRAVCDQYARFRALASAEGVHRVAFATRLGAQGPVRWLLEDDTAEGALKESAAILAAYGCYRSTRDAGWLRAELPRLEAAARVAGRRSLDALRPEAFERLAELEEEMARQPNGAAGASADSLRDLARRLRGDVTPLRGMALWRQVLEEATRAVTSRYGRLGAADAGAFLDRLTRRLFGVDERLDAIEIAPAMDGAFDDFPWRLEGFRVYDDTLHLTYRPSAREVQIRLGALRRRRLVLRFPWLSATSCATVQRGRQTERPTLVARDDGSFYLDIRGAFEPAVVTLAAACSG